MKNSAYSGDRQERKSKVKYYIGGKSLILRPICGGKPSTNRIEKKRKVTGGCLATNTAAFIEGGCNSQKYNRDEFTRREGGLRLTYSFTNSYAEKVRRPAKTIGSHCGGQSWLLSSSPHTEKPISGGEWSIPAWAGGPAIPKYSTKI